MINHILNKNTINDDEIINSNKNTFVETPICIKSKRAVLNPKSNDNK